VTERFTTETVEQLQKPLAPSAISKVTKGNRGTFDYVSGYHVFTKANRLFGFGGWTSSIVDLTCVVNPTEPNHQGQRGKGYLVAYTARVKVTVEFGGLDGQAHEDVGYGQDVNYSDVGEAHESASKEAVTDAVKRALRYWGNQFGLSLYDKERPPEEEPPPPAKPQPAPQRASAGQDDPNRPATEQEQSDVRDFGDGLGFTVAQSRQALHDASEGKRPITLGHVIAAKKKLTAMATAKTQGGQS
jgi:DNA repair and recombination protein RAD52